MASAGWERRNARARAAGYNSYYDYRAHDYGRIPAGRPRVSGPALTGLRGHRSSADLARAIRTGRVEMVLTNTSRRDARGRITEIEVQATMSDGSRRTYVLKGSALKRRQVADLQAAIADGPDTMLTVGSPGGRKVLGAWEVWGLWRGRNDRWLRRIDRIGRALTTPDTESAMPFADVAEAEEFADEHDLERRGFTPELIAEGEEEELEPS